MSLSGYRSNYELSIGQNISNGKQIKQVLAAKGAKNAKLLTVRLCFLAFLASWRPPSGRAMREKLLKLSRGPFRHAWTRGRFP